MYQEDNRQPVIEVSGLSKKYGDFSAVHDFSCTVYKGDVFGFLGQNGAGKSTTIRMLLTLIRPDAGQIHIFGKDLFRHRKEILSGVGAVIEKPDLYGYLSGRENLKLFAQLSGVMDKKAIDATLELVGMSARADDRVDTYSQGMRQRLGIATALVHDPELVILDEPTNGLDPQGIADIRNLIMRLSKEQGKTFFVSSHLLSEIELMANRMVIIHQGQKIVEGEVQRLLDPEHQVVHLETTDDVQSRMSIAKSRWGQYLQQEVGDMIKLSLARSDIPSFVQELEGIGVSVIALRPVNRLEAYFLSLTHAH